MSKKHIEECIRDNLESYFKDLRGVEPSAMYDMIRAVRGAGGGLKLARPAAAITLADIVEAVEGPIALTACVETGKHDCGLGGIIIVHAARPVQRTLLLVVGVTTANRDVELIGRIPGHLAIGGIAL